MLKLQKIYEEAEKSKYKYDLKFINGGFSGNIDMKYDPQVSPDTISVKIAIYGGGKPSSTSFQVPQQFAQSEEFQAKVKAEMSQVMVKLLKQLDIDAAKSMKAIIERNIQGQ